MFHIPYQSGTVSQAGGCVGVERREKYRLETLTGTVCRLVVKNWGNYGSLGKNRVRKAERGRA